MNFIDAYVFGLLAIADIALLAYLRHRHRRSERTQRLMRCLEVGIHRETKPEYNLRRAS